MPGHQVPRVTTPAEHVIMRATGKAPNKRLTCLLKHTCALSSHVRSRVRTSRDCPPNRWLPCTQEEHRNNRVTSDILCAAHIPQIKTKRETIRRKEKKEIGRYRERQFLNTNMRTSFLCVYVHVHVHRERQVQLEEMEMNID